MLADSLGEVKQAFDERRFGTAPPHPEPQSQGSMLFRARGPNGALYPHFAAQFAAVRWTNIYDECANPLFGDVISGSLSPTFGPGIGEHNETRMRRAGSGGWPGRIFTHTSYWDWAPDTPMPDHVDHLCRALKLGS